MKIYVVIGVTGEYSDRTEWLVVAYKTKSLAKEHVIKATEFARKWEVQVESEDKFSYQIWKKEENPLDPIAPYMDYTGISYYYEEVNLID